MINRTISGESAEVMNHTRGELCVAVDSECQCDAREGERDLRNEAAGIGILAEASDILSSAVGITTLAIFDSRNSAYYHCQQYEEPPGE